MELTKYELIFLETLLEDEIGNLNIKRSKSKNVNEFDEVVGERMEELYKIRNKIRKEIN